MKKIFGDIDSYDLAIPQQYWDNSSSAGLVSGVCVQDVPSAIIAGADCQC